MKKHLDVELMRIVACFFVIFNHTGDNGFFLFAFRQPEELSFWIYCFISVFCKFSVPLFFALSGALLLGKNEELTNIWRSRILKIVVILFAFSAVYYLIEVLQGNQVFNMRVFLEQLYSTTWNVSFWYLYAYIAFLVGLPFLRAMVSNLKDKYFYYMFVLVVLIEGVLPVIEYFLWQGEVVINSNVKIGWICSNIVVYPCLGYFLWNRFDYEKNAKKIPILWFINIITILLSCYMTYRKAMITGELSQGVSQSFHNSFVLINCATIFITIRWFFMKVNIPEKIADAIRSLGGCTFGIYLLHMIFVAKIPIFKRLWGLLRETWNMNQMMAAFLFCFCVMIAGYISTIGLKKVPLLKKIM